MKTMINIKHFDFIKQKYSATSSWAVWEKQGSTPKSNVGNMNILNPEINKDLLCILNPNVVLVGLNLSGWSNEAPAFSNFHSSSPWAQDYKIRYAFNETSYWGAYMTDVVKEHIEPISTEVMKGLRKNQNDVQQHIENFQAELRDIGSENPIIIAFGGDAHSLLKQHLSKDCYSLLIGVTHYSHHISKEEYREKVHKQIAASSP